MFFAMDVLGFSQPSVPPVAPADSKPQTRRAIEGSDTVSGYQLSPDSRVVLDPSGQVFMRLPATQRKAALELMGMLQQGPNIELYVRRLPDLDPSPGTDQYRLEIYRGKRGGAATFVHDFPLDGAYQWVRFFQPPNAGNSPAVFIAVNPGSLTLWTYLLAPNRQSMQMLFESSGAGGGEFIDLDHDGVYELIGPGNGGSSRCTFSLSPRPGPGTVPQVFVRAGAGYRQVFPPRDLMSGVVDGTFADLRGDGAVELIALQEDFGKEPAQALAVYRLENKSFRLLAQTSLPPQPIAFLVDTRDSPRGKEILVRSVTPAECEIPGAAYREDIGTVKAYRLNGNKLEAAQPETR